MNEQPGDIIRIWLGSGHLGGAAPKYKFLICVCDNDRRYLAINSDPRRASAGDDLQITQKDLGILTKPVSYVDCSRLVELLYADYADGMNKPESGPKGKISDELKVRILKKVVASRGLTKIQKKIIFRSFGVPYPNP